MKCIEWIPRAHFFFILLLQFKNFFGFVSVFVLKIAAFSVVQVQGWIEDVMKTESVMTVRYFMSKLLKLLGDFHVHLCVLFGSNLLELHSQHVNLARYSVILMFFNKILGRNRKRRKIDPNDVEDKLESLISKVGEKVIRILHPLPYKTLGIIQYIQQWYDQVHLGGVL